MLAVVFVLCVWHLVVQFRLERPPIGSSVTYHLVFRKYYPMTANTKDILTRINGCSKATSTARAFLKLFTVAMTVRQASPIVPCE